MSHCTLRDKSHGGELNYCRQNGIAREMPLKTCKVGRKAEIRRGVQSPFLLAGKPQLKTASRKGFIKRSFMNFIHLLLGAYNSQ